MINRKLKAVDIFSEEEISRIHQTTLVILEKQGIEVLQEPSRAILKKSGARVEGVKVFFPPALVEEQLKIAPGEFTLHARNPAKSVLIGGHGTVLAPGYGSPFVMDTQEGIRRNSNFGDYITFTKLAGASENMDLVGGLLVEPGDLPLALRHLKMFYAAVKYSDKCLMGSAMGERKARESVEMAAIVFGGLDYVRKHPVLLSLINTNSPLQLDGRMLEAMLVYVEYRQPVIIASLSMTGTTAPQTLAAALVQQNAEIISGIVLAQLAGPGTPVIYGSASSVVDLKTGGLAIGSPETAKMFAGAAQLARFYGLPSRGGGALTDSLLPDAQSGFESMMNLMGAVYSGFNFILHSAGLLENYMTMCFEKFIIDDEICGMVKNFFQGMPVDEEHLGLDTIGNVGSGGNYLTEEHTFRHMRDLRAPLVSSRQAYAGAGVMTDTVCRARKVYRERLAAFEPPGLDPRVEAELLRYLDQSG